MARGVAVRQRTLAPSSDCWTKLRPPTSDGFVTWYTGGTFIHCMTDNRFQALPMPFVGTTPLPRVESSRRSRPALTDWRKDWLAV